MRYRIHAESADGSMGEAPVYEAISAEHAIMAYRQDAGDEFPVVTATEED